MTEPLDFTTAGHKVGGIDVRLSYKIVELFSEGLYASPNKAVEELVANSFDAGAQRVAVFLPIDFHAPGATIAVLDNGESMDAEGLRQHWLIGTSKKRQIKAPPKGRAQIGKFGIGKLATYVLASQLTHICKKDGKYFATSMDFERIDKRIDDGIEPKAPLKIDLRELTVEEAQTAVLSWTNLASFKKTGIKLFGSGANPSWTLAILSSLKPKVHEIKRGVLEWVLRTALPLRDDFAIYLDGESLEPSKAGKGRLKTWVIGKDIADIPKPAPDELSVSEDKNKPADSPKRHGLHHPQVGRITGYAEAYKELLTGKSDEIGRSHGFFVYVFGRLINVQDGHFGIQPNELRHGTFGRIRVVVHMDGLDDYLQSDRERIREGPILESAQNILRGIFNFLRTHLQTHDDAEDPGARLASKLAASPRSLSRRPLIEMVRAALSGKASPRYVLLPAKPTAEESKTILGLMEERAETPEKFVSGIEFTYDATADHPIAVYEAATGILRVNGLHPFIGAFFDQFTSKASGLPLEIFALAEVLLESHLHQEGIPKEKVDSIMDARDRLLRHTAAESGRRTAMTVANALRNARNNKEQLEIEVVAAFSSLGFEATRIGGNGKPDGVAIAHLSPGKEKETRRYAVTLEARSKEKDGAKLKTKGFGTAGIARQRNDAGCQHAVVVAPGFDHTAGKDSALAKELRNDKAIKHDDKIVRTITAIHVDDLARLVQLRPLKRLGLAKLRGLFQTCNLPEECKAWIDAVEKEKVAKPPYSKIVKAIHKLQTESRNEPVSYSELRNELKHLSPPINYQDVDELAELCKAMHQMAPGAVMATTSTVELDQSPANVIAAIEVATKDEQE